MNKNIIRLYLLVALSLVLNVVFIFTGHDLLEKNKTLRQEVSVLCGDLQDLRYLVETDHNNERGWRKIEESHQKMAEVEMANLEVHLNDLSKRVKDLEDMRVDSKSNKDMVEIRRDLDHIKKNLFGLANQVSSNMNSIRNLEENLQIAK